MVTVAKTPFNQQVSAPKTAVLIASRIRGQIVRGELKPGETLPSEPEFTAQLGVSRPTLREAFRILEAESLLNVRRGVGGGALVLAPSLTVGARYVGLLLQFDNATIADVYEARTILESTCAGMMAARTKNRAALDDLDECIDRVAALLGEATNGVPNQQAWSRTTYEFHELVLKGSGNTTLALQGSLLQEVVAMHYAATVPDRFAAETKPERFRRVLSSFRKLTRLVEAHDREGAYKHWLRHMQTASTALVGDDMKNKRVVDLFD